MNILSLLGAVGFSAVCGLTPLNNKKNAFVIEGDSYSFHSDYTDVYEYVSDIYNESMTNRFCFFYTYFNFSTQLVNRVVMTTNVSTYDDFTNVINYCNGITYDFDIGYIDYFRMGSFTGGSDVDVSWYRVYLSSYINNGHYKVNGQTFLVNNELWYFSPCYYDDEDSRFLAVYTDSVFDTTYDVIANHEYSLSLYGRSVTHDLQSVSFYPLDETFYYNFAISVSDLYGWLDVNATDVVVTFTKYDSSERSYNNGYDEGLKIGTQQGYNDGYDTGFDDGVDNGYTSGYSTGYTAGVAESNQYTFSGLFGSIADTPVLIIRNLFNFDLFGVNMLSVILSLFTGLIIFYLLRKLL